MSALLRVVVRVIVIGLCCWLLWWLIGFVGMGQPFDKIARVVVAVVGVGVVIRELLALDGGPSAPP